MVFIGQIHHHRQKRALEVFMLGSAKWRGKNIRPMYQ
jgi:hypothetical protein